ncbi:MAG: ABC transporter permease, partial [Deltaproteobacteria bacterium]|nr:ABC transporter permease [Deltaproteobacteria bacterium]
MGRSALFLLMTLVGGFQPPYKIRPVLYQIRVIGSGSFLVIFFTGAFVGMVLGLQGHYTLSKYGSAGALGAAVALSLIRELGPVLTALMVIGRTGSAMCAELGIMRISEQIDALDCMAINPYRFLVAPKLFAGLLSVPLLTAI